MKVLVTGCNGFAGRHAGAALRQAGHDVVGGDLALAPGGANACLEMDVRDLASISRALEAARPDAILHLGGIAFVPLGWTEPQHVFSVNTIGTLNLLDAVRQHAPRTRVLVVTSAEVYGSHPAPHPLAEDAPYRPDNIYGVAKAAADHASLLYGEHHHLSVLVARPSNHIGAGQSQDFVSSAFAALKLGPSNITGWHRSSTRSYMRVRASPLGFFSCASGTLVVTTSGLPLR